MLESLQYNGETGDNRCEVLLGRNGQSNAKNQKSSLVFLELRTRAL